MGENLTLTDYEAYIMAEIRSLYTEPTRVFVLVDCFMPSHEDMAAYVAKKYPQRVTS